MDTTFYMIWLKNPDTGELQLHNITQEMQDVVEAVEDNYTVVVDKLCEDSISPPYFGD